MDVTAPEYVQISEFRSRITYLTFPKNPEKGNEAADYVSKIVNTLGHASILAACQVVFTLPALPAGINPNSSIFKFTKTVSNHTVFFVVTLKELRGLFVSHSPSDPHLNLITELKEVAKTTWPDLFKP